MFNKKGNAAAAYDDDEKKPAAAQEQDDLAARPPPQNLDQLTMEQLEDSLFELADLWCPSISENEYCEFFDILI